MTSQNTNTGSEIIWEETHSLKDRSGTILGWSMVEGLHLLIWRCGEGYIYKDTKRSARPSLVTNIKEPPYEQCREKWKAEQ